MFVTGPASVSASMALRLAPVPTPRRFSVRMSRLPLTSLSVTLAEAENELNGPTAIAYGAINEVRARVSVGMPEVTPGLSKEEFREVIRLERRVEFAGEGLYYKDIIRWRTAEIVMNEDGLDGGGNTIERRSFNPERDYLWPIPDREVLLNPNLEQNPGY